MQPREILEEINELRFKKESVTVQSKAEEVWSAWVEGRIEEPLGLAAICQVAFANAMDTTVPDDASSDDPRRAVAATAQLWRARACSTAVQTGELNTMAMLLLPIAFQARGLGYLDTALDVIDEIGRLGDAVEAQATRGPGVPLEVIRRAQFEKAGYLLWRAKRYGEAKRSYEKAATPAKGRPRDEARVEAALFLCEVGLDEISGRPFDVDAITTRLSELREAATAIDAIDVAEHLQRSVDGLRDGTVRSAQDLTPMEIE